MKVTYQYTPSGIGPHFGMNQWRKLEAAGWLLEWYGTDVYSASKEFESPGDAMREVQDIVEQFVCDDGCPCCGPPHSFSWPGGRASGEECEQYTE